MGAPLRVPGLAGHVAPGSDPGPGHPSACKHERADIALRPRGDVLVRRFPASHRNARTRHAGRGQAGGGRRSSDYLPFFNLDRGSGGLIRTGYPGEWAAAFHTEASGETRAAIGQALTRLTLRPGEAIRTPRIALLWYEGDRLRGQNLWRRFVLDHHRPTIDGRPVELPLFNANWGGTSADNHLANIRLLPFHGFARGLLLDRCRVVRRGTVVCQSWQLGGQAAALPDGFKPLSDALHASGRRLLLWFEPERVCEGTRWDREFGRWLLAVPPERRARSVEKQTFPDWVKSESLRNQDQGERPPPLTWGTPKPLRISRTLSLERDSAQTASGMTPISRCSSSAESMRRIAISSLRFAGSRGCTRLGMSCSAAIRTCRIDDLRQWRTPHRPRDHVADALPWRTDFQIRSASNATPGRPSFWVPLNGTGAVNPAHDT